MSWSQIICKKWANEADSGAYAAIKAFPYSRIWELMKLAEVYVFKSLLSSLGSFIHSFICSSSSSSCSPTFGDRVRITLLCLKGRTFLWRFSLKKKELALTKKLLTWSLWQHILEIILNSIDWRDSSTGDYLSNSVTAIGLSRWRRSY